MLPVTAHCSYGKSSLPYCFSGRAYVLPLTAVCPRIDWCTCSRGWLEPLHSINSSNGGEWRLVSVLQSILILLLIALPSITAFDVPATLHCLLLLFSCLYVNFCNDLVHAAVERRTIAPPPRPSLPPLAPCVCSIAVFFFNRDGSKNQPLQPRTSVFQNETFVRSQRAASREQTFPTAPHKGSNKNAERTY